MRLNTLDSKVFAAANLWVKTGPPGSDMVTEKKCVRNPGLPRIGAGGKDKGKGPRSPIMTRKRGQ